MQEKKMELLFSWTIGGGKCMATCMAIKWNNRVKKNMKQHQWERRKKEERGDNQ